MDTALIRGNLLPNNTQRDLVFQKLGYEPSSEQRKVHESDARFRLVSGGIQSGKSYLAANELLSRFYEGTLFWLVAQDYNRTSAEYRYIVAGLDKLGLPYDASKNVDPGEIVISNKIRIVTKSASDPRKLAMEAPDGIIGCEASQIDYESFLKIRERASPKRAWVLLEGTFESSLGWYPQVWQQWQLPNTEGGKSFILPSWSNTHLYPEGRQDPEIKALEKIFSKDRFLERIAGVPCPPTGRVFTEFSLPMHVGIGESYEFDKALSVYIWVDPGYASAYSVLVAQIRGDHVYIVDEIFERGYVTQDIIKICMQRPWWNKKIGGAIDIAAKQHQAMPAPAEIWLKEGQVALTSQVLKIRDGIERVKSFLIINPITNSPLLHINAKCRGLISEMGGCENPITNQTAVYAWKKDREGNVVGEEPEDKHNHACKALAYGLVSLFGFTGARQKPKVKFI